MAFVYTNALLAKQNVHLDPDEYKPEEPIVEDEKKTGNDDGTWAGGDDEEW